jgi:hypothetical protein
MWRDAKESFPRAFHPWTWIHLSHVDNPVSFRGEVVCEESLLTVDRQMGLNIVHLKGKVRSLLFYVSIPGNALSAGENGIQQAAL